MPGLKTGVENGIFWSEIGSGFGELGGTPLPKIPRTSLSITRPCYLCRYLPDGLYPLKPRVRFYFLGYIKRRLSKKQNNNNNKKTKKKPNSKHFANRVMAWHRDSVQLYSDKARCFNQSGRALYRNFIIIKNWFMLGVRISSFINQHIVTLPKYGHGELNICRHNRYPAIYVVLVCQGKKQQSAFKK